MMTKIKYFTSILLLFFVSVVQAQQNVVLQALERPNVLIGGIGNERANAIQQTTDGGYIVAGTTSSSVSGDVAGTSKGGTDVWVVKLNVSGAIDRQKNYGGSGFDYAEAIQQTADGGYVVAGYTSSSASGDVTGTTRGGTDFWVVKLTSAGNISWQRNYGGSALDTASSIQQTADGGYIVAGITNSSASGDVTGTSKGISDIWLLKLTSTGNISWQRNYGGSNGEDASFIQQTADGGYIVAGATVSSASGDVTGTNKGQNDFWVLKLTSTGNISWQRNYGGSGNEGASSIQQTTDGGYIVAGYTGSSASGDVTGTNKGQNDFWVLKLTSTGNISWQKSYGGSGNDVASSIQQTTDGGYVMIGFTTSSASGDVTGTSRGGGRDVWVVKLTSTGNISWQKNYGGSGADTAPSIQQTTDGGYIVAGSTSSSVSEDVDAVNHGSSDDMWIFKLDGSGNIVQNMYGNY